MLESVSSMLSGKLYNSSEPAFLSCKIKKKFPDELFLGLKTVTYVIMSLLSIDPWSIYIPRSNVSVFANSVVVVTFRM